jgi:hypothetical protein
MEANDASLVQGDATTRAQELRASLGARQDAETMLAEAGRIRQDAAAAADALVEEAQQLSAQLVAESRRAAEQVADQAREQADGVLAQARTEAEEVTGRARATAEALRAAAETEAEEVTARARANAEALREAAETEIEEHRRRVRAEVTAQVTHDLTEQHRAAEARAREQSEALVSDLEASVRILGVSLESALSNVSELLGSLEALRPAADPGAARSGATRVADLLADPLPESLPESLREPLGEPLREPLSEPLPTPRAEERRGRPAVGDRVDDILFGGGQHVGPATSGVPSSTSPFGTEQEPPAPDPDRPRSATEAFLSSSSIEIEQASRELRDLQHPEEARRRRSEESRRAADQREADDDDGHDDEPPPSDEARPLGWLFRSAQ